MNKKIIACIIGAVVLVAVIASVFVLGGKNGAKDKQEVNTDKDVKVEDNQSGLKVDEEGDGDSISFDEIVTDDATDDGKDSTDKKNDSSKADTNKSDSGKNNTGTADGSTAEDSGKDDTSTDNGDSELNTPSEDPDSNFGPLF